MVKVDRNNVKKKLISVKDATKNVVKANLNKVKSNSKTIKKNIINKSNKGARALLKKNIRNAKWKEEFKDRGVVFVSRIPHGFYEKELYKYFSQFGKVTAIRLPRSEKTGRSKGFAFIEFELKEVAEIAAETMNNYLMFDRMLKTKYIPPEKQAPHLFHRSGFPWQDTTANDAKIQRRELDFENKNCVKKPRSVNKMIFRRLRILQDNIKKYSPIQYEFEINDPEGVLKKKEEEKINLMERTNCNDESDDDIKVKPPPNILTKTLKSSKSKLKSSKSKLKTIKNKTSDLIRNETTLQNCKATLKSSKSKLNGIKNIASKVVKDKTVTVKKKSKL